MTIQEWRRKIHGDEMRTATRVAALQKLGFTVTVLANGNVVAVRGRK